MISDKNKVVQNYILLQLKSIDQDEAQVWTAKHKILKRNFTLKRVKYGQPSKVALNESPSSSEISDEICERALRESNFLKRLNLTCAPKCHKVIKTSNYYYIVYDQIPSLSLKDHLRKQCLSMLEKSQLMANLAQVFHQIHQKKVAVLTVNSQNIFLGINGQILISKWSSAKLLTSQVQQKSKLSPQRVKLDTKQFTQSGLEEDIYSLGKIFLEIDDSGLIEKSTSQKQNKDKMIKRMLNKDKKERPTIQEVKTIFSNKIDERQKNKIDVKAKTLRVPGGEYPSRLKVKATTTLYQQSHTSRYISNKLISHNSLQSPERISSYKSIFTPPATSNTWRGNNSPEKSKYEDLSSPLLKKRDLQFTNYTEPSIKSLRISKKSSKSNSQYDRMAQAINSKRNLSFVLFDLSEFVMKMNICFQLSFLLFKQGLIILKSAVEEVQRDFWDSSEAEQFQLILKKEYGKMVKILNLMRGMFDKGNLKDELLRIQLSSENINNSYLRDQILGFGREMVVRCENTKETEIQKMKLVDILFKTYLILKGVQHSNYLSFWQKNSSREYARLSSQRYLREQKSLGYRYLKSKVAVILCQK